MLIYIICIIHFGHRIKSFKKLNTCRTSKGNFKQEAVLGLPDTLSASACHHSVGQIGGKCQAKWGGGAQILPGTIMTLPACPRSDIIVLYNTPEFAQNAMVKLEVTSSARDFNAYVSLCLSCLPPVVTQPGNHKLYFQIIFLVKCYNVCLRA